MATPAIRTPNSATDNPPRPRRWIPLSLRMLVGLMVILVCASVWRCGIGYRQLLAIRELEQLGYWVKTEPTGPKWLRDRVGDKWMSMFDNVIHVSNYDPRATDDAFQATQDAIRIISGFRSLRSLNLRNTPLTDAGLAELKGLANLEQLWLDGTRISDDGLSSVSRLRHLIDLSLSRTRVTDNCLRHLKGLDLTFLHILDTRVTRAAIVDFMRAHPDLVVLPIPPY